MNDEIALFIDFENIRYSLLNVRHREPDPQELIGVARRFGTVMVARAYADWTRQPDFFKGSLTAAMIDRVDCPAKLRDRFRSNAPAAPYSGYANYGSPAMARPYEQGAEQGDANEDGMADDQPEEELEGSAGENDIQGEEDEGPGDEMDGEGMDDEVGDEGEDGGDEDYEDEPDQGRHYEAPERRPYYNGGQYHPGPQYITTQSTVDLNMLMDMIETVFDRPTISTYVLMTGDRDFTRICARLKLRLNKRVVVVGVPGTVSRDLISAANQFIPLGAPVGYNRGGPPRTDYYAQGPVEPEESGFVQFLDYIDKHWAWRTVGGVANFIGDPFNPKNRFRGRLTRETARDLLRICIERGILIVGTDPTGSESLRLNRTHPAVEAVLSEQPVQ